jgi:hypothetical protein
VPGAVMGQDFRSPSSGSAAAAITPARLAQEFEQVLWRELPQGGIEVAVQRVGVVERLRVHDDGSTSQVASVPLRSYGWADGLAAGGFVLALFAGAVMWFRGDSAGMWPVVVAGVVIFAVGTVSRWRELRSQLGGITGWYKPTTLNGWVPRTSAQLSAVERIAEDHKGLALVRDIGAATIDVRAPRVGGLYHYIVDGNGAVELTETPTSLRKHGTRLVIALWLVAWIAVPPTGASRFGWVGAAIGCVIVLVVGATLGHLLDAEERLKRGHDGNHWVEIRTRIENNSD